MTLHEFTVHFRGDYTPELRQTYAMLHGEDINNWPDTETRSRVTIDISKIIAFNEIEKGDRHEGKTSVWLEGGISYLICIPYNEFKNIFEQHYLTPIPSNAL